MSGFQRPRGTRDFPPEEMEQRRYVESKLRQVAHSFNFGEVMTPTFENTELFIAKSGPAIIDEIYAFKDKGDREISLRPELTAAVMRYYVNELHTRPKPLKLYYMGNCFRYERPQKGRYREFFQFGAEIIGARSLEADAEILALAHACVMGSGAKISDFRIGHLGILEALFNKYEIAKGFQTNIRRYLDKRDFDSMFTYFSKSSLDPAALDALTEIVGVQGSPSHVIKKAEDYLSEDCDPIIYLKDLIEWLNAYGIQDNQVS
ncbi:MAG: histidine--tRNA ligase family protein, partial [Thermoplasmata archaeon]|nr:histidine--tRNA ligase family protein [Thermoplasmata archaeon]